MKLHFRFGLLVLALVLAVGAICFAGNRAVTGMGASVHRVVHTDMTRVLLVTSVRRLFRSMVVLERDYLLEKNPEKRRGITAQVKKTRAELEQALTAYDGIAPTEDRAAWASLRAAADRWEALDDRVTAMADSGDAAQALGLSQEHAKDPVSWEVVIADLVKANEARLNAQVVATDSIDRSSRRLLYGVSGLAALLALTLGTIVFRGIRRNMTDVMNLAQNLEGLVAQRTKALEHRERAMQLVLDSTGEGLLSVDLQGRVQPERSKAVSAWFGEPSSDPNEQLSQLLFPDDEKQRLHCENAFAQLAEDFLPFDINADQMPRRTVRGDRHLALSYRQVLEDGVFSKILIIVSDVTERIASERAEREAKEQQAVITCLIRDRSGFLRFIDDSEELLATISTEKSRTELQRHLHTLKGNTSIYAFRSVAERCHHLEEVLTEREGVLTADECAELTAIWRARLASIEEFIRTGTADVVEVEEVEIRTLTTHLRERRDYGELLSIVEGWRWDRMSEHLVRLRAQVERLSAQMCKPVQVNVVHNGVRIPPDFLKEFWPTLVHVVRNAVDHGIEEPDAREAAGKEGEGRVTLEAREEGGQLVVEIGDDGAGLDTQALLSKARAAGIALGDDPVVEALFADGVSTRDEVSEISGRGVGMGAVRAACVAAGGHVAVRSETGRGTTFVFRFPLPAWIGGRSVRPGSLPAAATRLRSKAPRAS